MAGGIDRGECGECTDVPDGRDDIAGAQCTLQKTQEVRRHDQPDDAGAETFNLTAHTQQRTEGAVGEKQKSVAGQQRKY